MRNIASAFLEIFNKSSKYDSQKQIFLNGEDNLYPDRIESVSEHSVTAKRAAALMASYIVGKGFGEELNNLIVNERTGKTALDMASAIGVNFAKFRGVFIHVSYKIQKTGETLTYSHNSYSVLPFSDCRIGKSDDSGYSGKIWVCSDWSDPEEVKKAKAYDVYNPDQNVIKAQIKKAKGIANYGGQILFYNFDDYVYPLSNLHPAIEDAESERLASVYKNKSLKKGFFGKTLVVTKPLVDNFAEAEEKQRQESEREAFQKTIQKFIGAENVEGVLHLELEFRGDKLEDEILFKNIDSNIDDKLFEFTERSVSDNIRMCFNNVPAPLIRSRDGALFGPNGEGVRALKEFYQDQTENERLVLQQIMNRLFKHYKEPKTGIKVIPLISKDAPTNNESGNSEV